MFQNFLKIAFRNIARHKGFSFINIAGLTLGITACILIGLFVWDENQYDKFLPGGEQVYRVYNEYTNNEGTQLMAVTPPMFATTLQQDFPEVETTTKVLMHPETETLFEAGNKKIYEENGFYVDSTFFDVFPLSFQYGNSVKSLDDINGVVISSEMANRFFDNENPAGKNMLINKKPYLVKGVFVKNPKFHLPFDYLLPLAAIQFPAGIMQSWHWQQFFTYAKLKSGTNVHALQAKFQNDAKQKSIASDDDKKISNVPFFQPLKDIHLYSSSFKFDMAQRGNITYVNALTIIAFFISLIACFNFINLANKFSTAML